MTTIQDSAYRPALGEKTRVRLLKRDHHERLEFSSDNAKAFRSTRINFNVVSKPEHTFQTSPQTSCRVRRTCKDRPFDAGAKIGGNHFKPLHSAAFDWPDRKVTLLRMRQLVMSQFGRD